jgi:hypothetical protein
MGKQKVFLAAGLLATMASFVSLGNNPHAGESEQATAAGSSESAQRSTYHAAEPV